MAARLGGYSRLVQILKIALPLAALAILSTLFLLSRQIRIGDLPAGAGFDITILREAQGFGSPSIVGTTPQGDTIRISARRFIPDLSLTGGFRATEIAIVVERSESELIEFSAASGELAGPQQDVVFFGGVVVKMAGGVEISTDRIEARPDLSQIHAPGAVSGQTPFGDFSAGSMTLSRDRTPDGPAQYSVLFQNGVKLLYFPKEQ